MGKHVCEICGRPAIVAVTDEMRTRPDKGGYWEYTPHGGAHWFCSGHMRGSLTYEPVVVAIGPKEIANHGR